LEDDMPEVPLPSFQPMRDVDIHNMPSVPPGATVGMGFYKLVSLLPQLATILTCGGIAALLLEKGGDHAVHSLVALLGPVIADKLYRSRPTGAE
jgi:hypothetical protein